MISDRGLVMAVGASLCVHALALGMGGMMLLGGVCAWLLQRQKTA